MKDYTTTPDHLPVPMDDGAADHLLGMSLPALALASTQGGSVDLSLQAGDLIIFCYPMTGQPGVPLPEGWDDIPGARGCTPQNICYRDHHGDFTALGAKVFGVSMQTPSYQREMAERLQLPFAVLSDEHMAFTQALRLPTFHAAGMQLIKRLTLIARQGKVAAVKYPVFPSHSDAPWAVEWLRQHP